MDLPWRELIIVFAVMLIVLGVSARRRKAPFVSARSLGIMLFALYIVLVFSITGVSPLSGFHTEIRMSEISLIPFDGMKKMLAADTLFGIVNIAGNVFMFLPLGLLLPLLWSSFRRWWKTLLAGLGLSLVIELWQLFISRGTDVDDLIFNAMGALLGYFVFLAVRKIFERGGKTLGTAHGGRLVFSLCLIIPFAVTLAVGFYDRYTMLGLLF